MNEPNTSSGQLPKPKVHASNFGSEPSDDYIRMLQRKAKSEQEQNELIELATLLSLAKVI